MAKYRAKAPLYVGNRLIAAGETFTSDAVPGSQWEPLDKPKSATVDIPEDWEDMNPEQRINLARQLGAPVKGTKVADADKLIKAEVRKRAEAAEAAETKDD